MNIMLVNIEFFTGHKKIKQRHISFVPGLLKKAHVINKNIDGFYPKTTQEDSTRFV
jgi:hypothetical protein